MFSEKPDQKYWLISFFPVFSIFQLSARYQIAQIPLKPSDEYLT